MGILTFFPYLLQNTELTFNYQSHGMTECFCEAEKCAGFVGANCDNKKVHLFNSFWISNCLTSLVIEIKNKVGRSFQNRAATERYGRYFDGWPTRKKKRQKLFGNENASGKKKY